MIDIELGLLIKRSIWLLLLPPNGFLTLALLGALMSVIWPWRRAGARISLVSLLCLYVLLTPPGSQWLAQYVERQAGPSLDRAALQKLLGQKDRPQAIVILGGGAAMDERERPYRDKPSLEALERVLAGARLARWSGLPVLTSGGTPRRSGQSEAKTMAHILKEDFGVPVRWLEEASLDTAGNAYYSHQMLSSQGISHVVLVTQAMHIPRARQAFEAQGLTVTAAPIGFMALQGVPLRSIFVPDSVSSRRASFACHEIFGIWWYAFRRWYDTVS